MVKENIDTNSFDINATYRYLLSIKGSFTGLLLDMEKFSWNWLQNRVNSDICLVKNYFFVCFSLGLSIYIYSILGPSFSIYFFIKYLYCLCFQLDQFLTVWNFFCLMVYVQCYKWHLSLSSIPEPTKHSKCLLCHLLIYFTLYFKHYVSKSDFFMRSSLIRVQTVCFHDKNSNVCIRTYM